MDARILADVAASIAELKANPMKVATSAHGEPVAVLNRNNGLGKKVINRKMTKQKLKAFMPNLPPCEVGAVFSC